MSTGKVYLVGSGPGDMELITVKGCRLLRQADVVLYDHLIAMELLSIVRSDAEKISVGKFAGNHTMQQQAINKLLVDKAKQGKTVVRLKGGDPYLFGRGGEEAQFCFENNVYFEVVPGVTSAFSVPCYAGIPPTHRDFANSVAIVSGHRKKGDQRPIDIPKAGTVIFLMSVASIPGIIKQLLSDGWKPETPIAAIEHGTWYDQQVIEGTIENFLEIIKEKSLRTPGIFVVGKVIGMRGKLSWFSRKPRILMLGTHPEKYTHLGTIVHRQLIKCVPLEDYTDADEQIDKLNKFSWIVFTSANGIRHFFARLKTKGLDSRTLAGKSIAVIGETTAGTLAEFGINADLTAKTQSSKGLLEAFKTIDLSGAKILLPQAEVSSELLPNGLHKMDAEVTRMAVYKTVECDCDDVDFEFIDQVLFTSGSSIRAFIKRFGSVPENIKAYCLGLPTLSIAKENRIKAEVLS